MSARLRALPAPCEFCFVPAERARYRPAIMSANTRPTRTALAAVVLAASACSGAPATPKQVETEPRASASTPASESASAAASALPGPAPTAARAAPEAGRDRLRFSVPVFSGPGKVEVGVELDVPSGWGIKPNSALGPSLMSCTGAMSMLPEEISVGAHPCKEGEAAADCVKRLGTRHDDPNGKKVDNDSDPLRRWVEQSVERGETIYDGTLYQYDPTHRVVVTCGYFMSRAPAPVREAYRDVCSTLALAATDAKLEPLGARDPKPDATIGNAAWFPHGDALAKVALEFHRALQKGDTKLAESFMMGPADCAAAPKGRVATCKQEMGQARRELEKVLPQLRAKLPQGEPAGVYLMPISDGGGSEGKPLLAYMLDGAHPCAPSETGWMVMMVGAEPRVVVAMKAKEKPAPKPKKK
jgi:hypothetical protein